VHPVIDHFLDGHEGTAILINRLGQEVLVANKGIRSADWIISVVAPTEEVFAPIAAMQQRLLGMTLILTLIGAALTWWFIRRQFVPLEQGLHSLAVMRQPGQPLTPLPVSREDEIGQLVGAFNALIAEVEVRETALRESDDCLRSILATSLDGFWRVSEEGRLLEVNETYARMSGYTMDELVGMHVSQLVADESPSVAAERHAKILATGHLQFEDVHRRKDGSVWHMESSATYRAGGGGQVVAFIRDISARKRDEARCARRSTNSRPWCSNPWSACTSSATATGCTSTRRWPACSATPARQNASPVATSATWSPRKAGSWLPKPAAPAERRDRSTQLWLHRLAQGWHAHRRRGVWQCARIRWAAGGAWSAAGCSERKQAEAELERYRLQLEDLVLERTRDLAEARDRAKAPTAPRAPSWAA
jgi:PAS domain S-box-containing protein